MAVALLAHLPPIAIPAGTSEFTVQIDASAWRDRALAAARDRTQEVFIDLGGIESDRPPAVFFEIHLHASKDAIGKSIGNLTLYGSGIRSESHAAFRPAHLRLPASDAIRACLAQSSTMNVTFVAQGAGGTPAPARSAAAISIAMPAIVALPRTRD